MNEHVCPVCGQLVSRTDTQIQVAHACVAYDGCDRPVHRCEFDGDHDWPGFAAGGVWDFFESQ